MKLNALTEKEIPELLSEGPRKTTIDEPIRRPLGISEEDFTAEYQDRLKDYQKRRPELYHKIVNGL